MNSTNNFKTDKRIALRILIAVIIVSIALVCLITLPVVAATDLSAGDMAFVGVNSDGDDGFAFLLLKDITSGTSVYITDRGWTDGSGFSEYLGEGIIKWTASSDMTAGTSVYIRVTLNGISTDGNGNTYIEASAGTAKWVDTNDVELVYSNDTSGIFTTISYTGDQIFIYQGSHTNPDFITGIHYNVEVFSTKDNWDGSASSNKTSALPDDLTKDVNAVWVHAPGPEEEDCFRYKGSLVEGTPTDLNAAINNVDNWETLDNNTAFVLQPFHRTFVVLVDNFDPTDIDLSSDSIDENSAENSIIGLLSTTDPDEGDTFTYTLAAGSGDTDNTAFNINSDNLRITNSPNHEDKSSYSIRVRTTDQDDAYYEESYTISINDINETPSDIDLSVNSIIEGSAPNSTVGTLSTTDPDAGNTFSYTLVEGSGDSDNTAFNIDGDSLRITDSPDYDVKNSYSIRIRTTDQGSLIYEETFIITIDEINEAPTDIDLSDGSIDENVSADSMVGTLSTTDHNTGNTFTYALESGIGDIDNAAFNIVGNSLLISGSPDYETKNSYSIRIRTTDQGSLTYEEIFIITINNLNEVPTDITLSAYSIEENVPANSTIGTMSSTDQDIGNTFTYTFTAGSGDTDNSAFNIDGDSLRITDSPDYDTKSSYTIRIRTTDQGSLTYEESFTITIDEINEAPTDIDLTADSIDENVSAGSTVGTLSTTDHNTANTFTYTLVVGDGDTDNAAFNISGDNLSITDSPDYDIKNSYSIRIRTTDQGNLTYEETFTISINNLNEVPTDIVLSEDSIEENVPANSKVGSFSTTDQDAGNTFTYTLVSGSGDADNGSFNIDGGSLRIINSPDYDVKNSYSIRIRTTDQGSLAYEETFTITIDEINETPTDIDIAADSIDENSANDSVVGALSTTDNNAGDTFTYTLVAGSGDSDNGTFNINGDSLRITNSPDYESKNSYSIRLRTTDHGNLTYEETFIITVSDINELPTDMALTSDSIIENVPANSTVGTLSTTDQDMGNTFTYTLVAGSGDTDNSAFNIDNDSLRISDSPDYDIKNSYSIRIRTTDQGGLVFEETFIITIDEVNEAPTDIDISAGSVDENAAVDSLVGTLSTTDHNTGNTFTYTLVAGSGDADNTVFSIVGDNLLITESPDFELKGSYSVRICTTDQGSLSYEEIFVITVNDINEAPTDITLSADSIKENVPVNSTVGSLGTTDQDAGNTFSYVLTAGGGDTDNGAFDIDGNSLNITVRPDYESKKSYSIRIRTTDQDSLSYEKTYTITIINLYESNRGNRSTPFPVKPGFKVFINGDDETVAASTTETVDGRTVTTITVDDEIIEKLIKEDKNPLITIAVNSYSDMVIGRLTGKTVKNMVDKEVMLVMKTQNASFTIPVAEIKIDDILSRMGGNVDLEDVIIDIRIAASSQQTVQIVQDTANRKKYQIVIKPVDFEIICTSGNGTEVISKFSRYIERTVAIPDGIDPYKITTGIVLNNDGTFSHVPTSIVIIDGTYYIRISSLTNSTYSAIFHEKSFDDVSNHWAKETINEMGSRLIVSGVGDNLFEPDREITRAEFVKIVVNALGLTGAGSGKEVFNDVAESKWYYDVIGIANDYGLLSGYGNGNFGPNEKITREEAMIIISRTMKITKLNVELKNDEVNQILEAFSDFKQVNEWAKKSVASCIQAGLVNGKDEKILAPQDMITRAEAATIIKRLLQNSGLIL